MSVPWPVVVYRGPDHVVDLVNREFAARGFTRQGSALGRPFREAFPDLSEHGLADTLDHAFRTGETYVRRGFHAVVSRAEGHHEGYWDLVVQPIRECDGQVAGLLSSFIEVTEQVRALERVNLIADAGLLLDAELDLDRTLQNLADLLLPRLADYCLVDLIEGDRLRRALAAHANPAKRDLIDRLRALDPDPKIPAGVAAVLANGKPLLAPTIRPGALEAASGSEEHLALLRALDPRSSILFPLRIHGAPIGLLTVTFAESGRRYGEPELQLVADLALRVALAISTARSVQAERHAAERLAAAREAAETAAARVSLLQRLTSALSTAVTVEDAARAILAEGIAALGAGAGGVWLVGADPGTLELVHSQNFGVHGAAFSTVSLEDALPLPAAVKLGAPVLLATPEERVRRYPKAGDGAGAGYKAWAAIPLTVHSKVVGGVSFSFPQTQRFSDDDRDFMMAMATQAAQAIERARLYEAVVERERQAKLAERRKDEFLAMLGHELRNPLSPVQMGVEIIRRKAGRVIERECDIVERQVVHLTRLVDDLLDVARISRGKIALQRERQELGPVIARAVEIAKPLIDGRKHELIVAAPPAGLVVDGDTIRLAQVVSNLLTNAARYTPPGGRISVTAGREGDRAVIRVKDTGVGIPEHMLSAVFDLFVQGDRRLDRSEGGLGIGLTLARSVIDLHGGTIEAFSEGPNLGTELTVRLPLCAPDEAAAPGSTGGAALAAPAPRRRVLVVDDNVDTAAMTAELIRAEGHEVATANDGHHALIVATELLPDIVLLDIGLPGLDGYQLAARLRKHPLLGAVRLIAVTGYGQEPDKARGREAGFEAHYVKPVPPETLLRLLRSPGAP